MRCLYRNRSKCNSKFSQEHVLPQSIGGNIRHSNPFTIQNVCMNCNSLAGLYLDGPFIRTWFLQSDRASFAIKYIDIKSKPIVPFRYMGTLQNYSYGEKICEVWLGPTGDSIFHFHIPYPVEPHHPRYIGEPPLLRKLDHGFTFLFVVSNNPMWYPVIFNSFANHFDKSINYLGNGLTPNGGGFRDIPPNLIPLSLELKESLKKPLDVGFSVDEGFDIRFLAKLALGFGSLLLKQEYQNSEFADKLRHLMWEKDPDIRKNIQIKVSGFFATEKSFDSERNSIFSWKGGHFICIYKLGKEILLHMILYEQRTATIQISDDPTLLDCPEGDGYYYVVVPSLQRSVGPKKLHTYYEHITGKKDIDLEMLEEEMNKFNDIPPYRI